MSRRFQPGQILDGFALQERVKLGGMAEIWRVSREGEAGPLVMKIPLILDGDDPTMIVGFEMEQMILPRLRGPHVPRFVANGDFARQPFIVMELVEGRSLYERSHAFPLPLQEAVDIGAAVARAVDALHRQNVLHLDIKPANVIVRPDGMAVLIDFGLAHHLDLPDLLAEEFRVPMGTAPYMAPEQILKQRDDARSDIFALGAMLYEMVTGRQPYGDPKSARGMRKRLWWDPVRPKAIRPECPDWLQELIMATLSVDPDKRPPTARHLAFALAHPESVSVTQLGRDPARDTPIVRFKRWLSASGAERRTAPTLQDRHAQTPIVVAAVDLSDDYSDVAAAVRTMASTMLNALPGARLACVNVLKIKRIGIDEMVDADGRSAHVNRIVALRHWAEPLKLGPDRVTFHVLEDTDPGDAILGYARANGVDQIVMGARTHSATRRYLGSVSAKVAAEAPCSVTIVRVDGLGSSSGSGPHVREGQHATA